MLQKLIYLTILTCFAASSAFCGNKNGGEEKFSLIERTNSTNSLSRKASTNKNLKKEESSSCLYFDALNKIKSDGNEADYEEVFQLLKKAYGKGHSKATLMLAQCYMAGLGIDQNIEQASTLLDFVEKKEQNQAKIYLLLYALLNKSKSEEDFWDDLNVLKDDFKNQNDTVVLDLFIVACLSYGIHVKKNQEASEEALSKIELSSTHKFDQIIIITCFKKYKE